MMLSDPSDDRTTVKNKVDRLIIAATVPTIANFNFIVFIDPKHS